MAYVIIGLALLFILVPILSVLPNARQKAQMRMRAAARAEGVVVELTQIEDPNPKQDKYISGTGRALAPILKTAAYRTQRRRSAGWRDLPIIEWQAVRRTSGWDWTLLDEGLDPEFVDWLKLSVESLPADVEMAVEESWNITVHWHERVEGSETDIFEFLKNCAEKNAYPDSQS